MAHLGFDRKIVTSLVLLSCLGVPVAATTTTIDFEGLSLTEGTLLTTEIPGLTFSGAIVAHEGSPAVAYGSVAGDDQLISGQPFGGVFITDPVVRNKLATPGIIEILFDQPATDIGFWVADIDSREILTANAFDIGNNLLETVTFTASQTDPDIGDGLAILINISATHVSRLAVTVANDKNRVGWGIDNLSFRMAGITGFFADEVVFFEPGPPGSAGELGQEEMRGPPDQVTRDLDGGGATFGFSQTPVPFDVGTGVPNGTDLVLIGVSNPEGVGSDPDELDSVLFGYGEPVDSNGDGIADNVVGTGVKIGSDPRLDAPWRDDGFLANLQYYDFDDDPSFIGITGDFFLAIDDTSFPGNTSGQRGDLDIDAIFVLGTPEPSSLAVLVGISSMALIRRRRVALGLDPSI